MRRFDTPAAPPGWAGQGAELLRIVDPTGRAIAWLAPGLGANCVGYAVRHDSARSTWHHLIHSGTPRELRADPLSIGCAVVGPEPARRGSAHLAHWRFVERDPTAATCSARCDYDHLGIPGVVRIDLAARLEDAALHLDLLATNEGNEALHIVFGVRLNLAAGFRPDGPGLSADRPATFVGADPSMHIAVSTGPGTVGHTSIDIAQDGRLAIAVQDAAAPDMPTPPGYQRRLAVVIAAV